MSSQLILEYILTQLSTGFCNFLIWKFLSFQPSIYIRKELSSEV